MKATIWSEEFRKLCEPKSDEQFEKIVRHVDAYASEYLAQNNSYLSGRVDTLYKDLEIAKAENAGLKAAIRAQPEAPALTDNLAHIREALSRHDQERDDLTLGEAAAAIQYGYFKVRGRTDRAMLLQIAALLSAPAQAAVEPMTDAQAIRDAALTSTMAEYIVAHCGVYFKEDLNGPDYFICRCCDGCVETNYRGKKPEDVAHEDGCLFIAAQRFLSSQAPQPVQCPTCDGHGLVSGHEQDGSWCDHPCPECSQPSQDIAQPVAEAKIEHTARGFALIRFTDRYDVACTVQKSSLATENAIWIGCSDANPRYLVPGEGWRPVEMPSEYVADTRMHLTTDMVGWLLPILRNFVETGELSASEQPVAAPAGQEPLNSQAQASNGAGWFNIPHDVADWYSKNGYAVRTLYAAPVPAIPAGFRLIPIEPDTDMEIAGMEKSVLGRPSIDDPAYVLSIYKAMTDAAPQPTAPQEKP